MAQTTVLTAQTTAADSDDIVVGTKPVKASLYSGETDGSYSDVKCPVQEKVPGGIYQMFDNEKTMKDERTPVYLSDQRKSYTIISPGTYRVTKAVTDKDIGVFTEDGSA